MRFYADRLRGLLDELGLSKVFLLGHSTGGMIAQEFYRGYATYVSALILADTRYIGSGSNLEERLRMIGSMTPAQLADARAPKLLTAAAPQTLVHETISIMSEVRPVGYDFAARALAEADTRDVLSDLRIPTLLIWGAEDEITPLWDQVPAGSRLEVIPNAGHLCYAEQPERFNAVVRDFLLPLR